jgi:hypothetical protein
VSLKELEKRLQKEPGNLGLKVTVAGLLHEAGRSVEAVELYRAVALAYRDAGRKAQATAVCKSILELAPEDEQCRLLLASLTALPPPEAPRLTPPPPRLATPIPQPMPPVVPPQRPSEPKRRSSLDETPLPKPVPHHVADPTTGAQRVSPRDLRDSPRDLRDAVDADPTKPDAAPTLQDLAAELETRPRKKLDSSQVRKLEKGEFDDGVTPVRDSDEITRPRDKLPEKD